MKKSKKSNAQYDEERKRLNRVIGQVEGIKNMIEKQRDVGDILIQFKAIHQALKSVESRLLRSYLKSSVLGALKSGKKKGAEESVDRVADLFRQS